MTPRAFPISPLGFTRAELLALSAVILLSLALLFPLIASSTSRARDAATFAQCQSNLAHLGQALLQYAHANVGHFPLAATIENPHPELTTTLPPLGADPHCLYCPAQPDPTLSYSDANLHTATIGYFYYNATAPGSDPALSKFLRTGLDWPHILTTASDPQSWLLSDLWLSGQPTAHSTYHKGVNFLTLNGSVDFTSTSPRKSFH